MSAVGLGKNLNVCFQEYSNIKNYSELEYNINMKKMLIKVNLTNLFNELPSIFSNLI